MTVDTGASVVPANNGVIQATKVTAGTGTVSFAGPSAARVKTVSDAADTLAELGKVNAFTAANTHSAVETFGGTPNATGVTASGTVSGARFTNTGNGDNILSIIGNSSHTGDLFQVFDRGSGTKRVSISNDGTMSFSSASISGASNITGGRVGGTSDINTPTGGSLRWSNDAGNPFDGTTTGKISRPLSGTLQFDGNGTGAALKLPTRTAPTVKLHRLGLDLANQDISFDSDKIKVAP